MSNTHDTAEQLLQQAQQKSQQGQYQESIGLILKARELFIQSGDTSYEFDCLYNLVFLYSRLQDLNNAYKYAVQANQILPHWKQLTDKVDFRKSSFSYKYDDIHNTICIYLYYSNDYDKALHELKNHLEFRIFWLGENSALVGAYCYMLARIYRAKELPYCEKTLLKKAKSIIEQSQDVMQVLPFINNRLNEIGTTLFAPKDDDFRQIKAMFKNF